ncbi:MAG: hypothetical protein KME55_26240 [Nostoc indistinguendum CM1-VF10]|nr:hypothetical protein [Nostoc indistinguendum CM1-VF10]
MRTSSAYFYKTLHTCGKQQHIASSLIISQDIAQRSHISAQSIQVCPMNSEPLIIIFMHIMHISEQAEGNNQYFSTRSCA